MRAPETCLLFLCTLVVVCFSGYSADLNAVPGSGGADERAPAIVATFERHRAEFRKQRDDLDRELERIDEAIAQRSAALTTLREEKRQAEQKLAATAGNDLRGLRALTHSIERATVLVLQPLPFLGARLLSSADVPGSESGTQDFASGNMSPYLSILLPLTLGLALFVAYRFAPGYFQSYRVRLQRAALFLMLVLPLSSFAQPDPNVAVSADQRAETSLKEVLREAEAILGLSKVQRYIKLLTSPGTEGERVRISDVDLSATPFTVFSSVVVGSGEYHAMLAALYLADENPYAALRQFEAMTSRDMRYATQSSAPQRYEALVSTVTVYLLREDEAGLAADILRLNLKGLRSEASFALIYPELLSRSLILVAGELAAHYIDTTNDAAHLVALASTLYETGLLTRGRAALSKALGAAATADVLAATLDIALAQKEAAAVNTAVGKALQIMDDLAGLVSVSDRLRDAGWKTAANALLDGAIERSAQQDVSTVDGEIIPTTQALVFLSYESFERNLLPQAERAAVAAIKPLSRAERSELIMPAPPSIAQSMNVPKPDSLVSPLYFGLLAEAQGQSELAKKRFVKEGRTVIESVVSSDGLYVPDMFNHLSLLGWVLTREGQTDSLAKLDGVLLLLEQQMLDELRQSGSTAVADRRSQLQRIENELTALTAENQALQAGVRPRSVEKLSTAFSAILLLLRGLGLLAFCGAISAVLVGLAWRYAMERQSHRGFAFCCKLVEGAGWVWLLSVFSAPLGLLIIGTAQFFMLYQVRIERLPVVRKKERSASSSAEVDEKQSAAASPASPQDADKETLLNESVLQLLRDTKKRRAV